MPNITIVGPQNSNINIAVKTTQSSPPLDNLLFTPLDPLFQSRITHIIVEMPNMEYHMTDQLCSSNIKAEKE